MLRTVRDLTGAAAGFVGPARTSHRSAPATPPPNGPSARPGLAGEALAGFQLPRLLIAAPRLARVPRGDGGPVVDIPGWRGPQVSMAPIRAYLRWLGYDARTWGLGTNMGNPVRDAERMTRSVVELSESAGRPVGLVGWSLGGVIAREVARKVPEHVTRVVTYGTPVAGVRLDELNASAPIKVPITAIFTRRDGVVAWPACIDRASPDVEHVEVSSTHIGLGIDPDVWETVARTLAHPLP